MCQFDLRLRSNRGDWIRTSDRSAPSRVRYQTAPRPEAGDRTRTGTESLEGSCATVTPRPRNAASLGPEQEWRRSRPDWNADARPIGATGFEPATARPPAECA